MTTPASPCDEQACDALVMNRLAECREYWKTPVTWSYSILLSRAVVRWNVSSRGVDPRGRHLKRNHRRQMLELGAPIPDRIEQPRLDGLFFRDDVGAESIRTMCEKSSNFPVVMLLDSSRSWFETEVHELKRTSRTPRGSHIVVWLILCFHEELRTALQNPEESSQQDLNKCFVTKPRSCSTSWNTRIYAPGRSIPRDHISSARRWRATWV